MALRKTGKTGDNWSMYAKPLAFVDLETTGTSARVDRIIEIGLVLRDPNGHIEEFESLVNPDVSLPPFIESLTGIKGEALVDAPRFAELAESILEKLEGRVMVAHNARFDYGFLRQEFARLGIRFNRQPLCTVKLSRKLYPAFSAHNLDALIGRHGLSVSARHRALGDARVLNDFLETAYREHPAEQVDATIEQLTKRSTLPQKLNFIDVDSLPDACGVYRFYDDNNTLLYVGKSVNIRARVLSHFSEDIRSQKEANLARQVARVEWTETAGELGALLLESREIKTALPILNRRQRRLREMLSFRVDPQATAHGVIDILPLNPEELTDHHDLYGLFRSKKVAQNTLRQLAKDHGLCLKLLGLEAKSDGPCFAHQLGQCRGACAGKELVQRHHLRLFQALAEFKLRHWPFEGRIGVREVDGRRRMQEVHVLENWCYLGTVKEESQLDLFRDGRQDIGFDLDCYKILTRFFDKHADKLEIVALG